MKNFEYTSTNDLIKYLNKHNLKFVDFVLLREEKLFGNKKNEVLDKILNYIKIMRLSVEKGLEINHKSDCCQIDNENLKVPKKQILSDLEYLVFKSAVAVSVNNCNMGKIVACPTAGSCGIIPGVIIPIAEKEKIEDDKIAESLIVSGEIGRLIAKKTGISGAYGGCMAECGTASAMAAAAVVYIYEGTLEQMFTASAIALKNNFGLVCDPVAGLVEVPCIKRNAVKSIEALTAAQFALNDIYSAIPLDEVIEAAGKIAKDIPEKYKETSKGGLAITKTGLKIKNKLIKSN